MKKRLILAVSLLLAVFLVLPAAAEDEDGVLPDFPEEAEELLEFTEDEGGWLFQEGSFTGPQSLPDDIMLYSAQTLYNTIYNGLKKQSSAINVSSDRISSTDTLTETYYKVINDHPELYYAQTGLGWTTSGGYVTEVRPKYLDDLPSNHKALFEAATEEALAQLDSSMSDLEKALVLHDYLVVNCAYNWGVATEKETYSDRVYSAYGALADKNAVCQGYALAYKYLLDQAGISCITVSSERMNHMWNMVQMDGKWYHVDVTYDDPVPNQEGRCYHRNFLVSDSGIAGTNHYDWVRHYTCSDTTFESGYAFNNVSYPMYYWNNKNFYYIKNGSLWYGDLQGDANDTRINVEHPIWDGRGAVWHNDVLYYLGNVSQSGSYQIFGYDLKGQTGYTGPTFSYTATASPDGSYDSGADWPGMRYNNGLIQVVSPTRRAVVYSTAIIQPKEYPEEWDSLTGTQIAGLLNDGRVGVKQDGSSAIFWVAGYNSSRKMISLTPYILPAKSGITLLDVNLPSGNGKLMITDSSGVPLGDFWDNWD